MQQFTISSNDANQRLDRYVRKILKDWPLGKIYQAIRTKKILVNGAKKTNDYRLVINDVISFDSSIVLNQQSQQHTYALVSKRDFKVIYEDDNLLVVFKPVGLLVHDDEQKSTTNTLINQVISYLVETKQWSNYQGHTFKPSLVHRIDRNTCGLVLIAKNAETLRILNDKMKQHQIKKFYLAKIHGIPNEKAATKKAYLTRNFQTKLVTISNKPLNNQSLPIETKYQVISHNKTDSIVRIELITGRTHQIRAHFNYLGHPLYGEKKYTKKDISDQFKYQALCAYQIDFAFNNDINVLSYLKDKRFQVDLKDIWFLKSIG